MKKPNLHEEFLKALQLKVPQKDLAAKVGDILRIERDAAYRRLSGKVAFSVQEIGILAGRLNISLDKLIRINKERIWLPFILEYPMKMTSMDNLMDMGEAQLERIGALKGNPRETGNIFSGLPMEFYLYSPILFKFMFFRWGHHFIGTEEFNNYRDWKIPERILAWPDKVRDIYHFDKAYYIWDEALLSNIAREVAGFYRMHIITVEEKNEIRESFKDMLNRIEKSLNGTYIPSYIDVGEVDFYVSPVSLGFTSTYFMAGDSHVLELLTNFSFAVFEDDFESFKKMKQWLDSFKNISTMLSRGGRLERRVYFEQQRQIIDNILG